MKQTESELISERVNVIAKVTLLQVDRCLIALSKRTKNKSPLLDFDFEIALADIAEVVYSVQTALDTATFWAIDAKCDDRVKRLTEKAEKLNTLSKYLHLPEDNYKEYLSHFLKQNEMDGLKTNQTRCTSQTLAYKRQVE